MCAEAMLSLYSDRTTVMLWKLIVQFMTLIGVTLNFYLNSPLNTVHFHFK